MKGFYEEDYAVVALESSCLIASKSSHIKVAIRKHVCSCEDAVNSLAYEADARLRDPVYGCVGLISILQRRLKQVQNDLEHAKRELANYIGPSAVLPVLNHGFIQQSVLPCNIQPEPVLGLTGQSGPRARAIRQVQNQQQQQPRSGDLMEVNGGLDVVSAAAQVNGIEFSHMTTPTAAVMSPCLSLGGSYDANTHNTYQIHYQPHHLQHHQLFLQQLPPQRAE
ncbi:hypothetical protein E3N88_12492 [Mikania micrantha]|uniref:LOB domain-containing protein n=1 Tax=Mikania micrantha TaxID=192012 RepID=A0A5N6P614_9ASTR|nr:hypothetical protein E3N88_12492 [Mikania micrantha]